MNEFKKALEQLGFIYHKSCNMMIMDYDNGSLAVNLDYSGWIFWNYDDHKNLRKPGSWVNCDLYGLNLYDVIDSFKRRELERYILFRESSSNKVFPFRKYISHES